MIQNAVKTMTNSDEFSKGDLLKMAAGLIIGIGADMAVSALFGAHMPAGSGWRKTMRKVGVFVLSMKIGEDAENYFYKVYNDVVSAMNEAKMETQSSDNAERSTT